MKKLTAFLCLLLILGLSVGCAAQVECSFCGKIASCRKANYLGHQMDLCDNCYNQLMRD